MGFTLDASRKPVYTNTPQTVADLQADADFTAEMANYRVGTDAARVALTGYALREGLYWWSTDTNILWFRNDTPAWVKANQGLTWTARKGATQAIAASTMTNVFSLSLPASAPAGRYTVTGIAATWTGSAATHFKQLRWGGTSAVGTGTVLAGSSDGLSYPAATDLERTVLGQVDHTGGAIDVFLDVQVNAGSPNANPACSLQVIYHGVV